MNVCAEDMQAQERRFVWLQLTPCTHTVAHAHGLIACLLSRCAFVQSVSEAPSVHGTYPCATYGPSVATLQMAVLSMLRVRPELLRNDTCTYMYYYHRGGNP